MERIKNEVFTFFAGLLKRFNIPKGYHKIKTDITPEGNVVLVMSSITDDPAINVIPKIRSDYVVLMKELINAITGDDRLYDSSLSDIKFTDTSMTVRIDIFMIYLNMEMIPIDLLVIISSYLLLEDYFNFINVIKLRLYPSEVIQRFKRSFELPSTGTEFNSRIATIDDNAVPIIIESLISSEGRTIEEKVTTFTGQFISGRRYECGARRGLYESWSIS